MRELPSWRQIITRYRLKLTRAGASWRGPCPLHGGKNPTAFVITEGRGFYCHNCGANGGVLQFLKLMNDPEATEWPESGFARSGGIYTAKSPSDGSASIPRTQEDLPEVAPISPLASDHPYLRSRGVTPEVAAAFGCGFYRGSGPMARRIVFPVHDAGGRLVGHVGRSIGEEEPRYRFSRGLRKSLLLYNEHRVVALHAKQVILVEGVFDVLAVTDAGMANVVSALGCQLSIEQARRLRAFEGVWILFDDDEVGCAAAALAARWVGSRATVLQLPSADPSNLRRETLMDLLHAAYAATYPMATS